MIEFESLKIAMVQDEPGVGLREKFREDLGRFRPDIIVFPEYFLVKPEFGSVAASAGMRDQNLSLIRELSIELDCLVIGGTIVDTEDGINYNRSYLIDGGVTIGHYDKIHLYRNEGNGQITPGKTHRAFQWGSYRIGLLICADVLYPESFQALRELKPDLTFIPTTSPYKPAETPTEKFARDLEIFANGAVQSNSIVFKASATGSIIGHRLQGRSLIASPGKILWRVQPQDEDKHFLILAAIDGDKLNPSLDIMAIQG